jgi:hypothetical protein
MKWIIGLLFAFAFIAFSSGAETSYRVQKQKIELVKDYHAYYDVDIDSLDYFKASTVQTFYLHFGKTQVFITQNQKLVEQFKTWDFRRARDGLRVN